MGRVPVTQASPEASIYSQADALGVGLCFGDDAVRYVLKQKLLAWGDDFVIRDEHGNDAYTVDGKVFSWGDKLIMRDRDGSDVAVIDQKMLHWGPTYEIQRAGAVVAVVKKHLFTFFHAKFSIDVPGPDDLEASGDFLAHEY